MKSPKRVIFATWCIGTLYSCKGSEQISGLKDSTVPTYETVTEVTGAGGFYCQPRSGATNGPANVQCYFPTYPSTFPFLKSQSLEPLSGSISDDQLMPLRVRLLLSGRTIDIETPTQNLRSFLQLKPRTFDQHPDIKIALQNNIDPIDLDSVSSVGVKDFIAPQGTKITRHNSSVVVLMNEAPSKMVICRNSYDFFNQNSVFDDIDSLWFDCKDGETVTKGIAFSMAQVVEAKVRFQVRNDPNKSVFQEIKIKNPSSSLKSLTHSAAFTSMPEVQKLLTQKYGKNIAHIELMALEVVFAKGTPLFKGDSALGQAVWKNVFVSE